MPEQPLPPPRPPTLAEQLELLRLEAQGIVADPDTALHWRRRARLRGEDGRRVVPLEGEGDG